MRLWDVETGQCLRTFEGHSGDVGHVCISADGRYALSVSTITDKTMRYWKYETTIQLWEVKTGKCLRTYEGQNEIVATICMSSDGRFALSIGQANNARAEPDKTIQLWDVGTGGCLRIFEGHTESVHSICLSADGRYFLSGSSDKTMRLWRWKRVNACAPSKGILVWWAPSV